MRSQGWKNKANEFVQEHRRRKHWFQITVILAVAAVVGTTFTMILPAITMEHGMALECQLDLHTHDSGCYGAEGNLICGYADFVVHTHDGTCYDDSGNLICPLSEMEVHEHTEDCYTWEEVLSCALEEQPSHIHSEDCYSLLDAASPTCGTEETAGHTHGEDCYQIESVLVCDQEEGENHSHTDPCYEEQTILVCDQEETAGHTHTTECYPDAAPVLTCTQEEQEGHTHTDTCYEMDSVLTCSQPEIILHTHSDSCYGAEGHLTCGMLEVQEHHHTESCIPEPEPEQPMPPVLTESPAPETQPAEENIVPNAWIDLAAYISEITVTHGDDVPVDTVTEGDDIYVDIEFSVPGGIVTSSEDRLTYQVPGITISEDESGNIYHMGGDVGDYTITVNGLITMYFDQDYVGNGAAFVGQITFHGTVAEIQGDEQAIINFGSDKTMTVLPKTEPSDIAINKSGIYKGATGDGYIEYEVRISSDLGTDGDITFTDCITDGHAVFDTASRDSITVRKYSNNVPTGEVEAEFSFTDATISGTLPALEANEWYEITYTVKPDYSKSEENGELDVHNTATVCDEANTATAQASVEVSGVMIRKTGSYNKNTHTFSWTVTINEAHRNLNGYTLNDATIVYINDQRLETATVTDVKLDGQSISLPYRFQTDEMREHTLTYSMPLPEGVDQGDVVRIENPATLTKEEGGFQFHYSAEHKTQITVDAGTRPVKYLNGGVQDDGTMDWSVTIQNPDRLDAGAFTYRDVLLSVRRDNDCDEIYTGAHYMTANELKGISITSDTGVALTYGENFTIKAISTGAFEATYKDGNAQNSLINAGFDALDILGWQDLDTFDGGDRISAFEITFIGDGYANYGSVTVHYSSQVDFSALPSGVTMQIYNLAKTEGGNGSASGEYYCSQDLVKEISPEDIQITSGADVSSYTGSHLSLDYDETGGVLHYRILMPGNGQSTQTVYDVLPPGTEIVHDTVRFATHLSDLDGDRISISEASMGLDNEWGSSYISYTETLLDDGSTLVAFTLTPYTHSSSLLGVYYDVDISGMVGDGDETLSITNSAYLDGVAGVADSTTTDVAYSAPILTKERLVLDRGDDEAKSVIQYYVTVNTAGKDLVPDEGSITLMDTFHASGANASLRLNEIKAYHYDPTQANGLGSELPDSNTWSYRVVNTDDGTYGIEFTLPDSTACVIAYVYEVDRSTHPAALNVRNTVQLEGHAAISGEDSFTLEEVGSSASVNRANLTVYKVDSLFPAATIDAVFSLQRYEESGGSYIWSNTGLAANHNGNYKTENGVLTLAFITELTGSDSQYDTLYKLQEAEASANYVLDDTPHYVVWMSENKNAESLYGEMVERGAIPAGVAFADIGFIEYGFQHQITIGNTPTSIAVTKVWQGEDGAVLTPEELTTQGIAEVKVQLYQWAGGGEKTPYDAPVALSAGNDWTYTWSALPVADDSGNPYHYCVQEIDAAGAFIPAYSTSDITLSLASAEDAAASVTITNTLRVYTLPETGGVGSYLFVIAGLLLTGASGVAYTVLRHKCRGGGNIR